jgi:hypothetical protein
MDAQRREAIGEWDDRSFSDGFAGLGRIVSDGFSGAATDGTGWLFFADAWHAAGHTERPAFLGKQYYLLVENPETELLEAHGFAPHYELHVWVHRENPAGPFMPFNPELRCPEGASPAVHEAMAETPSH